MKLNKDLSGVFPWGVQDLPCPQGRRNDTLAHLVGVWLWEGHNRTEALALAKNWNDTQCQPPIGEKEFMNTFESIYQREQNSQMQAGPVEVVDQSQIYVPSAKVRTIPQAIIQPGGLLQEMMQYVIEFKPASFPLFNLGASICVLGTLVGQKVMTETRLRTNFYVFSLADSGTGKDAPLEAFARLIPKLGLGAGSHLGPNHVTSSAAIMKVMMAHWPVLMMMDEIGDLMAGLKRPNSFQADIPRILKEAFSATGRGIKKTYAGIDPMDVKWHHLSLYGTAAPGRFWKSLTFGDVTDGFLARVLILESDHEAPKPVKPKVMAPPVGLVQALKEIYDIRLNYPNTGQNKSQSHSAPGEGNLTPPVPQIVAKTPDAETMLDKWSDKYFDLRNQTRKAEDGRPAIYGRAAEHAHKLALVHAVSRLGANIVQGDVNVEDVQWATDFVDWVIPGMVSQVADNITVNEFDEWAQKIKQAIRNVASAERKGAAMWEIKKRVRGLAPRLFNEVMRHLLDAKELAMFEHKPPRGKVALLYGFA